MNVPNALSLSRIVAAPVFFVLFMLPQWTGTSHVAVWVLLWLIFLAAEITDVVDGHLARKLGQVSALGKVLDPLSDVITHATMFFCLVRLDIAFDWLFYAMLLRELLIILIRMVLLTEGTALPAAAGGKAKSVIYAITAGFGILATGGHWFGLQDTWQIPLDLGVNGLLGLGVLMSYISFFQYLRRFTQRRRPAA